MNRNRDIPKSKRPFYGRVFFLDLNHYPQWQEKLEYCIKFLGGHVEGFLSCKVTHVVTDRPKKEWPGENEKETNISRNDDDSRSSKTNFQTNSNQNVNHNPFLNRPELYSRGKLIVSKTAQISTSTSTTDAVETACKRGIKLLPAFELLHFCEGNVKQRLKSQDSDLHGNNEIRIKTMKGHYIKLEDNEQKFKPSYKEFMKWPDINLESPPGCSPFSTKKKKVDSIDATPVATVTRSLEQISIIKENFNSKKAESITNVATVKKPRPILFCEICGEDFSDTFENHVDSLRHRRFVMNNENYEELMAVIESLPKYNFDIVEKKEKIETEVDEYKPLIPTPRTSPTATTFTLTSGTTKSCGNSGTFVRLHDYIQKARGSNSSPPATQQQSGELQSKHLLKEGICEENEKNDDADFDIVEASAVTPVKDPLRILRSRLVLVSEEF